MSTSNAERLRAYKAKMKAAGFKRLSVYVHPDLIGFLNRNWQRGECGGRSLERLLLGEARQRPAHDWTNKVTSTRARAGVEIFRLRGMGRALLLTAKEQTDE